MATKPIPVRLELSVIARLDRAAKKMGTNRAALIKFLANTFLEHFEYCGGLAGLPHDWQQIMRDQDGRTRGGPSKIHFMPTSKVAETPKAPTIYPKPRKKRAP